MPGISCLALFAPASCSSGSSCLAAPVGHCCDALCAHGQGGHWEERSYRLQENSMIYLYYLQPRQWLVLPWVSEWKGSFQQSWMLSWNLADFSNFFGFAFQLQDQSLYSSSHRMFHTVVMFTSFKLPERAAPVQCHIPFSSPLPSVKHGRAGQASLFHQFDTQQPWCCHGSRARTAECWACRRECSCAV